jgi:uncharacterized membrane protein
MSVEIVRTQSERSVVLIAYVLHLVGATVGLTSIVGSSSTTSDSINTGATRKPPLDDPPRSGGRSWFVIGIITSFILIGRDGFLAWVWYVYRTCAG